MFIFKTMAHEDFEEYIRQGEPVKSERSKAWQMAIGLQKVDGLQTSAYLTETAKLHIEGDITIGEAKQRINSYYQTQAARNENAEERTEEADKVATRITELLGEHTFTLAPTDLRNRTLHIDWDKELAQSATDNVSKCQIGTLDCTLLEMALLQLIKEKPTATQKEWPKR
jgi:hypothetical protein